MYQYFSILTKIKVRKVLHPGSLLFLFRNMVILYTNKHLLMQFASAMGGDHAVNLPSNCVCGKSFSVEHSLSCSFGGFPTIRHNELCNVIADLLCSNVCIEPQRQVIPCLTVLQTVMIMPDRMSLPGAFGIQAFKDVRVVNPLAKSHFNQSLSSCYRMRKNKHMKSVSGMSSMVLLHL